jgi:hypothetical protein
MGESERLGSPGYGATRVWSGTDVAGDRRGVRFGSRHHAGEGVIAEGTFLSHDTALARFCSAVMAPSQPHGRLSQITIA